MQQLITAEQAAVAALCRISPGLVIVGKDGAVTPFGLLSRTFDDPLVGLEDAQMPAFFAAVDAALGEARVSALIRSNFASAQPSASVTIINIVNLIQFWLDHPEIRA